MTTRRKPTGSLLLLVTGDGANNGILLAAEAIGGAFNVALSLSSLILALAGGMLFLARLLPRCSAGQVTDLHHDHSKHEIKNEYRVGRTYGLDDGTLHGVILTSGLVRLVGGVRRHCDNEDQTRMLKYAGDCGWGRMLINVECQPRIYIRLTLAFEDREEAVQASSNGVRGASMTTMTMTLIVSSWHARVWGM